MDSSHSILKSAKSFFAGTALSRMTGLLRDIAMASCFGSSPEIAAFMVAYRFANLFRRLLGEGNLQAGFVPHFASLQEEGGHFFRDTAYSLALILLGVIAFLEMVLWGIKGWVGSDWESILTLTMWMAPGLFFICLYALNSALLQCRKKYFIPAAAPVFFNLVWILAVFIRPDVTFLACAITVAFGAQWLATVWEGLRLVSFKEWLQPKLFSLEFQKLLKPLFLGIVGISAMQLNTALDAFFARIADLQGPAFLWYAIRIQQLPLALFGIALSGALLPPLSRAQDPVQKESLLHTALTSATALMLAATFGIFLFGKAGVQLLFGHGEFTKANVLMTTHCLWAYGAGLVPSVWVLILAARFYAEKNYRTPMIASLASVGINVGLNALFVFALGWGAVSIAIATTMSAFCNALFLAKGAFSRSFWVFSGKAFCCCCAGVVALYPVQRTWEPTTTVLQALSLALMSLLFLACFAGCARLIKLPLLQKSR